VKRATRGETIPQLELKLLLKAQPELKERVNAMIRRLAVECTQKS
jgi:hypothetical protein